MDVTVELIGQRGGRLVIELVNPDEPPEPPEDRGKPAPLSPHPPSNAARAPSPESE